MTTTVLEIVQKVKQDPTGFVSLEDFHVRESTAVNPQIILDSPHITLYCLDHANRRAIFTETPPDLDLTKFPFFYQAQYEHAQQLIAVPYDTLHQLAAKTAVPFPPLNLIYSVGRCGSTLLSQVFDSVAGVLSLSEPDFFTNVVMQREENGRFDSELTVLLHSATRLLLKPLPGRRPHTWAIKFRSSGFEISDLMYAAFPDAHIIFLYRNAIARTRSEVRAFNLFDNKRVKMDRHLYQRWLRLVPLMKQYRWQARFGRLSRIEISALAWLSRMDRYLALHRQRVPMCAIRYEDLITSPHQIVADLFTYCHIPTDYLPATTHVFQRDSQAGSSLSRQKVNQQAPDQLSPDQLSPDQLSPEHLALITRVIQRHPQIKTADFLLPGTIPVPEPVAGSR